MQKHSLLKTAAVATAVAACSSQAFAQGQLEVVYNNTSTPANAAYSSALEFGDQVTLQGLNRKLTTFQFEYSATLTPAATKQGVVRMYANDGAAGAPGTLLFESDPFELGNGYANITIDGITGVTLPNTLTWTFITSGLAGGESAGVLLYNPPSVGASGNDYWQRNAFGGWTSQVLNNASGSAVANFSAKITAVPEPSTMAFAMVSGAAALGYAIRRRKA